MDNIILELHNRANKEKYLVEFSKEDIELIQIALMSLPEKHPYYQRSQELLKEIPLPVPEKPRVKKRSPGELQKAVMDSLESLKSATARQIAEAANLDVGAVTSILTRLERRGILIKKTVPNPLIGVGRGKKSKEVAQYFVKS